jgi:putative ribosome biogenesis GTPase RsgA
MEGSAPAKHCKDEKPAALRTRAAAQFHRDCIIAHPNLVAAVERLMELIRSPRRSAIVILMGPTGVGKSTLRRILENALIEEMRAELDEDRSRLPFISVTATASELMNFLGAISSSGR